MKKYSEISKSFISDKLGPKEFTQCRELKYIPQDRIISFVAKSLDILYPGSVRHEFKSETDIENHLSEVGDHLLELLGSLPLQSNLEAKKEQIAEKFLKQFPKIAKLIATDMQAALDGDPAACSLGEVIHCYPGPYAIAIYRMAHELYLLNIPTLPRILTELAHQRTGIDIHPGAQIDESLFIDHGTGVVIGETTIIGKNVKIYQGVTLGALSVEKAMAKKKRHPTIEEGCVIYAHATILGGETTIGKESVIGGNVWMTRSIPAHSLVYHKSEIKHDYKKGFKEAQEIIYEI